MHRNRIYSVLPAVFILFDKFCVSICLLQCGIFPLFLYSFLFAYTAL